MTKIILCNGSVHKIGYPFTPDIKVIAKALSHINRYTGHVGAYSVAQHSVLVAQMLPPDLRLAGLLHDATEAYLGDVAASLKALIPQYRHIEDYYTEVINDHFKVDTSHPGIKVADIRMLVTEAKSFGLPLEHFPSVTPYDFEVVRWEPEYAEKVFLATFYNQKSDIKLIKVLRAEAIERGESVFHGPMCDKCRGTLRKTDMNARCVRC